MKDCCPRIRRPAPPPALLTAPCCICNTELAWHSLLSILKQAYFGRAGGGEWGWCGQWNVPSEMHRFCGFWQMPGVVCPAPRQHAEKFRSLLVPGCSSSEVQYVPPLSTSSPWSVFCPCGLAFSGVSYKRYQIRHGLLQLASFTAEPNAWAARSCCHVRREPVPSGCWMVFRRTDAPQTVHHLTYRSTS